MRARTLATLCGLLLSSAAWAQKDCITTRSLNVSTGINPITGTAIGGGLADPEWQILAASPITGAVAGSAATTVTAAGVTANNWFASSAAANWISVNAQGTYATTGSVTFVTFRRTFRMCEADSIRFDMRYGVDNWIESVIIDGALPSAFSPGVSTATTNYNPTPLTMPAFARYLAAGTHTIDIRIRNQEVDNKDNPNGLYVNGSVTSITGSNSIVDPHNGDCQCARLASCSDTCYWKVTGNNIIGGNNIFGTITKDDVDIMTNNTFRGTMTKDGLLGWNTMTPTAYLHVNCDNNNGPANGLSDVRFENLEAGRGQMLVIDDFGYVYNSGVAPSQPITNSCGTINRVPKVGTGGPNSLVCSQITDITSGVGINMTPGTWTSGGALVSGSPASGTVRLDVNGLTRTTTLVVTSDGKLKRDIKPIANAMSLVSRLNGKTYRWNATGDAYDAGLHHGFIAQELAEVLPDAVVVDDKGQYAVNYLEIIPVLTEALKEQNAKIEALTAQVKALQAAGEAQNGITTPAGGHSLSQNVPNPFGGETVIDYNVQALRGSAFILIADLNGRELSRHAITKAGAGRLTVKGSELANGVYLYSLVVDGQEVASKRMVLSK